MLSHSTMSSLAALSRMQAMKLTRVRTWRRKFSLPPAANLGCEAALEGGGDSLTATAVAAGASSSPPLGTNSSREMEAAAKADIGAAGANSIEGVSGSGDGLVSGGGGG